VKKIFLLIIISFSASFAQRYHSFSNVSDTFFVRLDNKYILNSLNIVPFSESVFINNRKLSSNQYRINYSQAFFSLQLEDYTIKDTVIVKYQSINTGIKKEYKRRYLIVNPESNTREIKLSSDTQNQYSAESIFGKEIQRSGALIRGFSLGTNRDFTLTSGLRLQLNGKLADDITIVAALTDENNPIQPEGSTETLDELDKVFIELRHPNAAGTFGDYDYNIDSGEFSKINRKLQGLKGEFIFEEHSGSVAIAGSKGKYNSNNFLGSDGNQGPYRLYGSNNERNIIIIAGSEKVFLDGEQLRRGENNDYTIDYSNSEVTFTPKRLITSASRITIDFEYTDQSFKRNFIGANTNSLFLNKKLGINLSFYRDGDDENNPIDFAFTEEDNSILKNAGDDRLRTSKSGVTIAPLDSLGKSLGNYYKVDTLLENTRHTYYVYSPSNINSIYNITFTFVGEGAGDYIKESLGVYKFAGLRKGNYLPVIFLPMPQLKQIANLTINSQLTDNIKLSLDLSGSSFDKNTISNLDDNDNYGYARLFLFEILPHELNLFGNNLGRISAQIKDRFIEDSYSSLDRVDNVEFNRNYNLDLANTGNQILRELSFNYKPINNFNIDSKYGYIKQGEQFSADRYSTRVNFIKEKNYGLNYEIDYVSSASGNNLSNWNKQNGSFYYSFWHIKPGIEFLYDYKNDSNIDGKTAITSFRFSEIKPFVEIVSLKGVELKTTFSLRDEWFPLNNELQKQSKSFLWGIQGQFRLINEISNSISITFRKKDFTKPFVEQGYRDSETILLQTQNRLTLFNNFITGDIYYQASSEQTARLEKIFVRVPKGSGNYIYLGDLNNNGIPEENEFQLTLYEGDYALVTIPSDKLYPVMDLKGNTRWKLDFNRITKSNNLWSAILSPLSSETSWRIEENSKDPVTSNIYLLKLSTFLSDSTTIRGSQVFQQDFNLFQTNNEFSVRMRFQQRKTLNQYSGGNEKGYFKEKSLRVRFRLIEEFNTQTDFINTTDNLTAPISSGRARLINKNELVADFSYRPSRKYEVGLKLNVGEIKDNFPIVASLVSQNSQTLRYTFSLEEIGRLRIELERNELNSNNKLDVLPFEITKGNVVGKNYFWRAFFDFRISELIQTSVNYDGRLQGKGRVINTFRAEARAFF